MLGDCCVSTVDLHFVSQYPFEPPRDPLALHLAEVSERMGGRKSRCQPGSFCTESATVRGQNADTPLLTSDTSKTYSRTCESKCIAVIRSPEASMCISVHFLARY
jgi:hypothetical protein